MRCLGCAAVVLAVAGCPADGPADSGSDQVQGYRDYAMAAQNIELHRYENAMQNADTTTCVGIHNRYYLALLVDLERMADLAPLLDMQIADHGGTGFTDLTCSTTALRDELEAHHALACGYATIAEDQAEATRHIMAMRTYVEHVLARTAELAAGLGGGSFTWTTAASCQ